MSYSALASLIVLGDDLRRVDRQQLIRSVRELQLPTGRYVLLSLSVPDILVSGQFRGITGQ